MSYDIELRSNTPAADSGRESVRLRPLSDERRAKHKEVVAALLALNPRLDVFESESVIELTDVDDGSGLQVSLFAASGSISIPYWHEDQAALMKVVAGYLRVICEVGEYSAFDPQTGKAVTADAGYSLNPQVYSVGVHALTAATKKPWWKFW